MKIPPMPAEVAKVFDTFPVAARPVLKKARQEVYRTAKALDVGPLTETLKWGQPSYLTEATKSGSTLRLGVHKGQAAVFFNCQTTLVEGFRSDFPEAFQYAGNRALLLQKDSDTGALSQCLSRALTYHRDKRKARA